MGKCRKILKFFHVCIQPGPGWTRFAKSQIGQFLQFIFCRLKRLFTLSQSCLNALKPSGETSGCDQSPQPDLALPALFRRVSIFRPDANSPTVRLQSGILQTPISAPACDPALPAASPASPSVPHRGPHTFSGTLIPDLTSLVERFTARCPICDATAGQLCHLCGEPFCNAHLYPCSDCTLSLCGECTDVHDSEGHWGDSDTARAMFDSITGGAR